MLTPVKKFVRESSALATAAYTLVCLSAASAATLALLRAARNAPLQGRAAGAKTVGDNAIGTDPCIGIITAGVGGARVMVSRSPCPSPSPSPSPTVSPSSTPIPTLTPTPTPSPTPTASPSPTQTPPQTAITSQGTDFWLGLPGTFITLLSGNLGRCSKPVLASPS